MSAASLYFGRRKINGPVFWTENSGYPDGQFPRREAAVLLQPLPVTECEENPNMGYEGADLFSPDSFYTVTDASAVAGYLNTINSLLAAKGCAPLTASQISSQANQLKALVDFAIFTGSECSVMSFIITRSDLPAITNAFTFGILKQTRPITTTVFILQSKESPAVCLLHCGSRRFANFSLIMRPSFYGNIIAMTFATMRSVSYC